MPTPDLNIYGRTGLRRYGGYIDEELHAKLQSRDVRIRTYKEMSQNDPVIGGILFLIKMLARQVDWYVEKVSPSKADTAAAAFLEECMDDTSHTWPGFISEVLSFLEYGFSYFEICYKRRGGTSRDPRRNSRYTDGRIGWRKIEVRAPETLDAWEFDDEGGIQGVWQTAPPEYRRVFIPIEKGLLFRTEEARGNPEPASILKPCFRPWYFLKRIQEIEAIGIERDLNGYPVMEVPPEVMMPDAPAALKSLRTDLEKMISEVKRDEREGLIIPAEEYSDGTQTIKTGYKFRLASTGGARQFNTTEIITRYESRIAMTALADFLLLGHERVGSFALSADKTDLFAVALGTWLESIAAVLNRFAVPRLFALNAINVEELPVIKHGDIESQPLKDLAQYLKDLTGVGVIIPDRTLERRARQIANLPEPEEDEVGKAAVFE